MSGFEKQLGVVKDVFFPVDVNTRYDVYFTDRRVAIVCMGRANRFESEPAGQVSAISAFGVPPVTSSHVEKTENTRTIDEETKNMPLDDLLKLSKKSSFYTNEEIEEIRLILGHKPKLIILSEDCESKFSPDKEQIKQLCEILPTIETLRAKFAIAGKWSLLQELFKASLCK